MKKIDTTNIKRLTNQKIGYSMYERESIMKQRKIKTIACTLGVFAILFGTTLTVNAMTDNAIVEKISSIFQTKIIVNGKEEKASCTHNDDGTVVCTFKNDEVGASFKSTGALDENYTSNEIYYDYEVSK